MSDGRFWCLQEAILLCLLILVLKCCSLLKAIQIMSQSEIKSLHQSLASGLLPRSQEIHGHIKEFLVSEVKDFERINRDNDKVLDQLKDEWEQYNRFLSELKNKKNKDHKFIEGSAGYLTAKEEEINAKKKVLDSISTGLKETVTKIKPQKLAELPYEKSDILKEVFKILYVVLYNEPASKYDWPTFKKLGLLHNNGQDFVTRLANINFKDLPQPHYNQLLKLKNDEQFKDVCENSTFAFDVVDLADWVDYTCQGQKISLEKKQAEKDYTKIKQDKVKREDKAVELREEFCSETLKDIDHYQNGLMGLEAELRTIIIGMNTSVKEIEEVEGKRNESIGRINAI